MAHYSEPPTSRRQTLSRTCGALFLFLTVSAATAGETPAWKLNSRSGSVEIYERAREGSDLHEYKGIGVIDAPPAAVKRVLDDVPAYPSFMPYVIEARVIASDERSRISYQRLSPPVVGDRDYTVKVTYETRQTPNGPAYVNRWQSANEAGPAEKPNVTRVKLTEGTWLLEPEPGGQKTRATYTVFTNSGGSIPAFLLNSAGSTAVPKVFAAVRKQVTLPKYLAQ